MIDNEIESLKFYIIYSKDEVPPSFIESVLRYEFYKEK